MNATRELFERADAVASSDETLAVPLSQRQREIVAEALGGKIDELRRRTVPQDVIDAFGRMQRALADPDARGRVRLSLLQCATIAHRLEERAITLREQCAPPTQLAQLDEVDDAIARTVDAFVQSRSAA